MLSRQHECMVCDCLSDTGSRGVQANTWEWTMRMSRIRQSMPAVQTKHRWVGVCVHVCVRACMCVCA